MKKTIILSVILLLTCLAFAAEPTPKVLAAFQKTFHQATGLKWFKFEDGYSAFFDQNNVRYRVTYDETGTIVSGIRYYGEEYLPFLIKAKLNQRFLGKTISTVTEVTINDETYYEVVLEDNQSWIKVHADSYGNAFVKEKHKRFMPAGDVARQ